LYISPYVMGRLPQFGGGGGDADDTKRFSQDRFEEYRRNGVNEPEAFTPFGGGSSACQGSRFAASEGKVTAPAILRDFPLELTPEIEGT